VQTESDVLAVYPSEYKQRNDAPVRDSVIAAQTEMFLREQESDQYAADQANVARATKRYLDGLGEDRTIARSGSEDDETYRARILGIPELVTPLAILDAADAVLAPYTAIKCQYLESIQDRAYLRAVHVEDSTDGISGNGSTLLGASPYYVERLYPEDEAINGAARRQCSPGAAWLFADHVGRYFILRVPDISGIDEEHPALYAASAPEDAKGRLYLGNGGSFPSLDYLYNTDAEAISVYTALSSAVTAIVGHSVRWKMLSDGKLK
jgi:hypothetical protein